MRALSDHNAIALHACFMESDRHSTASLDSLAEPLREMRLRFEAVLAPHREALWDYCRRLTGSAWDAEDLVQETMLKAFASLAKLWQPVDARAYLFRIASNAWIDQVRRARRAPMEELEAHPELEADSISERRVEVREAMERLVTLLPPRQRVVLLLCDLLDFRAGEVAAMLGSTDGAVKSALQRARTTLARASAPGSEPLRTAIDRTAAQHPVVERYLAAFDARDADAIAALLHEEVTVSIVGCAEELGRSTVRASSLAEWASDPREQWVEPGYLEGRAAIFVFYRTADAPRALGWVTTLDVDADGVLAQRQYYFCPEFIRHAARALGVPAVTHGHQYVGGAS